MTVTIHEGHYSRKVFLDSGFLLRGGRAAGSNIIEAVLLGALLGGAVPTLLSFGS